MYVINIHVGFLCYALTYFLCNSKFRHWKLGLVPFLWPVSIYCFYRYNHKSIFYLTIVFHLIM